MRSGVPSLKFPTDPGWLFSEIKNGKYLDSFRRLAIVGAKRKSLGQHSEESKMNMLMSLGRATWRTPMPIVTNAHNKAKERRKGGLLFVAKRLAG